MRIANNSGRLALVHNDRILDVERASDGEFTAEPMEVFARPADTYVAGFIGAPAMNFLPAELLGDAVRLAGGQLIPLPSTRHGGPAITLGIRPEHVTLHPGGLPLQVELVEPLGSETLVHGRMADGTPLLLIHGFPLSGQLYQGQLAGLSSQFQVITPDLRGFGTDDLSAYTACTTLYRIHHPESSLNEARRLVAEWIDHHVVREKAGPTPGCDCN